MRSPLAWLAVTATALGASLGLPSWSAPVVTAQWRASSVLIQYVEFAPDGERIVTADGGGIGQIWKLDGQPVAVLKGQRSPMFRAHFSGDGQSVITTGYDGTGWVWTRTGGEPVRRLQLHRAATADAYLLPPGSARTAEVVSGSDDGTVVISRADGQTLWSRQFSGTTRQLRPSQSADLIAASSDNGQLHLISPSPDRRSATVRSIQTPHGRINLIRFNPAQSEVATAGADGTITLTPLDGQPQQRLVASTKGWSRGVAYCAGSPTTILSIGDDGVLRQWTQRGQLLASLSLSPSAPLTGVDCSASGRQAVVVNGTGQLWLLSVNP